MPGSVSVVVCAYTERRWDDVVRAVASVAAQTRPADELLLVIDHNEALAKRAAVELAGVTVVPNAHARGLSGARNTGIELAHGDVIAFLDDDAAARPDWLERLLAPYRDPSVAAVGGSASPRWPAATSRPATLPARDGLAAGELDWVVGCSYAGQPSRQAEVRNLMGCNMSFRREVFAWIGGFSDGIGRIGSTPLGCEETELCIRLRQRVGQARIVFEPAAQVTHRVGEPRTGWRYLLRRCWAEGLSKAAIAGTVGRDDALSTERAYLTRVLPAAMARQVRAGAPAGALAIAAAVLGTASGYLWGASSYAARSAWQRHRDLLGNAGSLIATTGITSALGFAFWALAARLFSQRAVGYGSAAVSAMMLLGTIGMFGLGTVLIGELPRRRRAAGLVSAALITAGAGSLVLGLGFAVVAPHVSGRFADISGTLGQAALFAAGVALTAVTLVFDQATIGLLRGQLQLSRNLAFAVAKLLALPAVAVALHDALGAGITLSWVAGTAVSLLPVVARRRLAGRPVMPRPDWGVLRGLGRTALAHNWLNLAITVPQPLIPVLVTVVVSPSANAAFYAAWMLAGFLYLVPAHLATVLFAVAAAEPEAVPGKLRFSLRMSLFIGLPGMAALALCGHAALGIFGAGYARAATIPLLLLIIGYLPSIPKTHFIAVCRAAGKIPRAAAVLTAAAAMEVAAAAAGGALGGLTGLSLALLGVYVLEGLVTAPAVVREATGAGRRRRVPLTRAAELSA